MQKKRWVIHSWGDKGVDWKGINDAAYYIGENLRRWGRVHVSDIKEKYGTVRVYTGFGWYDLHSIFYPGYAYTQFKKGGILWHLNCWKGTRLLMQGINWVVVPLHKQLYKYLYRKALRKWPHLRREILAGADWPELLEKEMRGGTYETEGP